MARVRIHLVAVLMATLTVAPSKLVRAGGGIDVGMDASNGPAFFGFVREVDGPGVAGADVTATLKSGNSVVTRTDLLGLYNPGYRQGHQCRRRKYFLRQERL